MATPQSVVSPTSVTVESGGEHKILGLTVEDWIKVIAFIIVLAVIASIVASLRSAANNPVFKDLGDAFGTAAGGLAWATAHWYLFLAGFLIAPFVPAGGKWAADRVGSAYKAYKDGKMTEDGLKKYKDLVIYNKKTEEAANETNAERKAALEKAATEAGDRYNSGDSEKDKEGRDEAMARGKSDGMVAP